MFNIPKQHQREELLGVNNKTKATHLENIPLPPGWQGNIHSSPGGQTAVARGQLLLLPHIRSQLICLDQQLKPTANPAHKIPQHSCHSPLVGILVPLTLASCYSPWLPLKSLFVCLIANEQNTTAYFLLCLKIFHGDVSCGDSFLQHMTKVSWLLAQKGSRFKAEPCREKKLCL